MGYWQERQEAMYKAGEMRVNKYFTRLEKAFNQTRRELQKTIDAFYFRYAEENGLSFATAQKKLDAEELGELRDFIDLAMQNLGVTISRSIICLSRPGSPAIRLWKHR